MLMRIPWKAMFVVQSRIPASVVRRAAAVELHLVHKPDGRRGCWIGQLLVGEVSLEFLWARKALGNGSSGNPALSLAVGKPLKKFH